jgi:integrase
MQNTSQATFKPVDVVMLASVVEGVKDMPISDMLKRDRISAVNRIAELSDFSLHKPIVGLEELRTAFWSIRPLANGMTAKTLSNLRSLFRTSLEDVGLLDPEYRGAALSHPEWGPLVRHRQMDKRLTDGMASFANWCASTGRAPLDVNDEAVQLFHTWLTTRTLKQKPKDIARRVPRLWNEACERIEAWPSIRLSPISFKARSLHLPIDAFPVSFQRQVEAYLEGRRAPDPFDLSDKAPKKALKASTLRQQREHIRLAASVLVQTGTPVEAILSLTDLVNQDAMKKVLRHYHDKAEGRPNAFAVSLSKTLLQVARYHLNAAPEELATLRKMASRLPAPAHDLTDKNKAMLRAFDGEAMRARLLYLPEQLLGEVKRALSDDRVPFVKAQVAIALDILLVAPLRPQNLIAMDSRAHLSDLNGSRGPMRLRIPAEETKTGQRDLIHEIPTDVAMRLRWYRQMILPRLGADPMGPLFVNRSGGRKTQPTLSVQITDVLSERLDIHMTPHQFRHFSAALYLDDRPEDFETVRQLLAHSWSKTTQIYAGLSTRRASKAFSSLVVSKRDALKTRQQRGKR